VLLAHIPSCFVFGAGPPPAIPPKITAEDLVIAADGGYNYIINAGIRADALIGDFDSLDAGSITGNDDLFVQRLPGEKDRTDMLAALQYGLERGYARYHIYGGTGGRLDHTIANIQCLGFLAGRGARGFLHDDRSVATALRGEIRLASRRRGVISIFAVGGPAEGVWVQGLKYELSNTRLTCEFPLGVSNAFTGRPVYIKAERGTLLIIYPYGTQELD